MTDWKIDRDIPIPGKGRPEKYPLGRLNPGDSVLIPFDGSPNASDKVRAAVANYSKRYGKKFATQMQEDGTRVWRIE